jgi:hypothetical protein
MLLIFENTEGCDEVYLDTLRLLCGPNVQNESMLDCACNLAPHTPKLGFKHRTYVDVLLRILDHQEEQSNFIQDDILSFLKNSPAYNTIIGLDMIEHLYEDDAVSFLGMAVANSHKQILFTPIGPYMLDLEGKNPEGHHSAWTPDQFLDLGWAVISFPNYHPLLGIGAFFTWNCDNIAEDFNRVKTDLIQKSWAKK